MILTYILFAIGFVLLIKGADLLVEGSSSIAKKLHISNIVIGLTIVAFGTSMPELIVNIMASMKGSTDIAIGNILGSNIANILLILGISAIIYPIAAKRNTVLKEIPFSLLAAIMIGVMANDALFDGTTWSAITRTDGLALLGFFIIFFYYIFGITSSHETSTDTDEVKVHSNGKSVIFILLGLVGLVFGGKWIVDGAVSIAEGFNISESLIGLTVVAIGTSLPELATSAVAAYKKQTDIAIGNVVGSNIFNIFWILGVSSVINPLAFNPASNIDIIVTIFTSILLFAIMYIGKRHIIERWQGFVMVSMYIGYIVFLVMTH